MKKHLPVIITGLVVGIAAVVLTMLGNPANMGFCIACFLRDISGAVKLHSAAVVQYVRPEIAGIALGALIMALCKKEWKSVGGSSPVTRFLLGMVVMIGALVFLGCPLRMVIRIGGGDLNAIVGLVGFIAGIFVGTIALKKGFTLKRAYAQQGFEGAIYPILLGVVTALSILVPAWFVFSTEGPGSMRAPFAIALIAGLVVGALAQRSRLCMAGGIRDGIMFKQFNLVYGFVAIIVAVLVGNLILGKFNLGFEGQPVAHTDGVMNFLGMAIVGWGSVLLGGCPLRQLILAGEGNSDSGITVCGYIVGAAFAHNFGTASSGTGAGANGAIAVAACLVMLLVVSVLNSRNKA